MVSPYSQVPRLSGMLRAFTTRQGNVDIAAQYQQRALELEARHPGTGGSHVNPEAVTVASCMIRQLIRPCMSPKTATRLCMPACRAPHMLLRSCRACSYIYKVCLICRQAVLAPQSLHSSSLAHGPKPPKLPDQTMSNTSKQWQAVWVVKHQQLRCMKLLKLCGTVFSLRHHQKSCDKAEHPLLLQSSPTGKCHLHLCMWFPSCKPHQASSCASSLQ